MPRSASCCAADRTSGVCTVRSFKSAFAEAVREIAKE
jgi:hypothetical protein